MNIPWEDVRVFLAVADTRSMSGAARTLRLGQPTVSRRVATLEHALGFALFRRSVDGVRLTPEGERLLVPARRMAEWAGEVNRAAQSRDRTPRGIVRIATFPGLAWEVMAPFAAWLKTKHPGLRLEVLSGIGYLDLARGEADLAIRTKPADQADLANVATLEVENAVFASKAYAKRLPRRYGPGDLDWIAWAPPFDALPPNPQLARLIPGFCPVFTSDNILVQRQAAEAGLGVMVLSEVAHRFARPTNLVRLAVNLGPHARGAVYLVCAKSALEIHRVRVVVDLLASELKALRPSRSESVA